MINKLEFLLVQALLLNLGNEKLAKVLHEMHKIVLEMKGNVDMQSEANQGPPKVHGN